VRPRAYHIVCIVGISMLAYGCARKEILAPEFSATLPVDGRNPARLEHRLQAGTYTVEIRESHIELHAVVEVANKRAELEDAVLRHGLLVKVVSLGQPADLHVEIRSADHSGKLGSAGISIRRFPQPGSDAGAELESGYSAFGNANELIAQKSVDAWARAADALHLASEHFRRAHDRAALAQTQYSLGSLQYFLRENWQGAVRAAGDASESYAAIDDEAGVQRAAVLIASAELEIASNTSAETQRAEQRAIYDEAERRLEVAAGYFEAHQAPVDLQYAIQLRGIRHLYSGNYEPAREFFSRAEQLARANQDPGETIKSLNNIAVIDVRLGLVTRAAEEYARLLQLVEPQQEDLYALVLGNYGACLIALGDFDRALELHTDAMQTYAARGDDQMRARQLAAIGSVYYRRGDLERALSTLRATIALQERISDGRGRAATLRIAGNVSSELGHHEEALDYLRQSRGIEASPVLVARTGVLIAGVLRALGRFNDAEAELGKALAANDDLSRANALAERAQLRRAQGRLADARDDLRTADSLYVTLALDFNRIDTNTTLSRVLLAGGDVAGATRAADSAVEIASRIRVKSANPEWRARFLSARYAPYEARIEALLAANGDEPDAPALWRAFLAAEEVRARSLADQLSTHEVDSQAPDAADETLRSRLTSQQLRLEARMARSDADLAGTLELQRAIQETRAEIDAHWLKQRQAQSTRSRSREFTASLAEVQHSLPPGTAVLAYFVGDEASHAWLLTHGSIRHSRLAGRDALQQRVSEFVESERMGTPEPRRDTAQTFAGTILDGLTEQRLLIIPDGPLNGMPFAVLPLGGTSRLMLLDEFVIGYAPSLALALQPAPKSSAAPGPVAVISDPVYASDDRRLMLAAAPGSAGTLRGPRESPPDRLTRLPYSSLEGQAVARAFAGHEVIELRGFDANAERVLALPKANLAVLHFATHADASKEAPEDSALYLSSYKADGTPFTRRRLTVNEIARSGLHADLVVLSGCATGDGSELRGEGVLGLTYGFLANGSRTVVASLWPIQDATTARFMEEFYRAYRISGRAADALRSAQLQMRQKSANRAVWSSFLVRASRFP